ncbi:SDR family oxidoreductase [Williamsia sp. CHRR-6]|uniref:SDR family NAD(P)-dependent oxidoreductase n=1 Tax=Williamsia sp. CHRR-6 TaxID=2835871 RepID=UPI001BDA1F42|nr:SDR family oxidoreductase [Williamsia sp. CHRR-6]MBT0566227.1 SDR family oxidoreductase [Williamsia sp. CHRR-6]
MTDLNGKVFVVVGATGALGSRIAGLLAQRGAALTVTGTSAQSLASVSIPGAHTVVTDLRLPDDPRSLIAAAKAQHGRIDGVINAAGVVAFGPLAEIDDDTVDDLVLIDFLGPLRLLRAALGEVEQGGVIAGISAVLAESPMGGMATYSAVKSATAALFAAAAKEARRNKIRVLDIRPPHTETGLAERAIAGTAPKMPTGLDPDAVAQRVVDAVTGDERDVPSSAFA